LNISSANSSNLHQPEKVSLETTGLRKEFDLRPVFKNINFSLSGGDSLAITGRNGSGKSTLIKILASILLQTSGKVNLTINGKSIERDCIYKYAGLVSPYLNLYDEFTGYENLKLVAGIRGLPENSIDEVLTRVGLYDRRHDLLKIYSSGMKQRLKIAFSIIHNPIVLLLDEPTSNLDAEGIGLVERIAEQYKKQHILIIATNDEHERSLCEKELNLNDQG
jgi:heme exporter protein A